MARGKTTKCPNTKCRSSMSACYVKVPRSGKIEYGGTAYYCRNCGTYVIAGPDYQ